MLTAERSTREKESAMSETFELLLMIHDLARSIASPPVSKLIARASSGDERISAIAAIVVLEDGVRLLQDAFSSFDIPLSFEDFSKMDDHGVLACASGTGAVIKLKDKISGITLEEAQAGLLLAAWQRVELARWALEASNRLAPAA
jgi:hypothetical protein